MYFLIMNIIDNKILNLIINIIIGLAWVSSLCRKQNNHFYENSLLEDHSEAIIGHVAAHELGHK
jgi:hypothetical protein